VFSKAALSDLSTGAVFSKVALSDLSTGAVFSKVASSDLSTGAMFPKVAASDLLTGAVFLSVQPTNSGNSDVESSAAVISSGFVDWCSVFEGSAEAGWHSQPQIRSSNLLIDIYSPLANAGGQFEMDLARYCDLPAAPGYTTCLVTCVPA
jgi:hypothetical protein